MALGTPLTRPIVGAWLDKGGAHFNVKAFGAKGDETTDDRAAFVATDGKGGPTIMPEGTYSIQSDLTISNGFIPSGGVLKPADGVVVTIDGAVNSSAYQWIDESLGGRVVVNYFTTPWALRQWWGYDHDGPQCPFTWNGSEDLPAIFYIKSDGTAYVDPDFDVEDFAPAGSVAYYVDFAGGNDANPGSEAQPLKTIGAAILKADVDIIYLHTGAPHKGEFSWANITRSIKWYPYGGGERAVIVDTDVYSWALTGGTTNVYQTTRQDTLAMVLDAGVEDSNGDFAELELVADVATCDATPGSYFISGTTLYVHTADSRAADADVWPMRTSGAHVLPQSQTQYMENISIYGGTKALLISKDSLFFGKGVHFKYSYDSDGLEAVGAALVMLQDCVTARNQTDGNSYRPSTTVPCVLELNCTSRHNGLRDSNNTNNGSTAHTGVQVVRINGTYYMNKGPNVVDVGGSESWNVGCTVYDSASLSGSTDEGRRQKSNFFSQEGHMWIEGGESRPRPNGTAGSMSLFDFVADQGWIHLKGVRHGHQFDLVATDPNFYGSF